MSHQQAKQELERGTPPDVICATCPWDRLCVEPPAMSQQEYERHIDKAKREDQERNDGGEKSFPVGMLMTTLAFAGSVSSGRLCPVFALRLRGPDGRKVADGVRDIMRTYGEPA
jgi:hypothetical protein